MSWAAIADVFFAVAATDSALVIALWTLANGWVGIIWIISRRSWALTANILTFAIATSALIWLRTVTLAAADCFWNTALHHVVVYCCSVANT